MVLAGRRQAQKWPAGDWHLNFSKLLISYLAVTVESFALRL
jgi:hypothetical protein